MYPLQAHTRMNTENGIVEIGTNMDNSVRISHEVCSNISEISIGLKEISKIVRNVQDHAALLGETGSTLNIAVQRFKTKDNTTVLDLKLEIKEKTEISQLSYELK